MTATTVSDTNDPTDPAPDNKKRNRLLWLFTATLFLIGIILFLLWLFIWQFHQSTDDAYSNGSLVSINTPIDGSVVAFYADDTDLVEEGKLLVELDPTYYQVAYDKALAALGNEVLLVKQLYDTVLLNEAAVEVRKVSLSKARYDYGNRSALVESKAISNEDYTHSRDDLTIAENELKISEFQLKSSVDAVGTTTFENHPRIQVNKNNVREAYYSLKHTKIYAPTTGYVALRSVNVGQSVSKTKSLMTIIPTNYVWVDANFKETQLKNMRIGQPAEIWFDLYGSDVKFEGKVLGIASGTGSIFSLIPPQNATGNWIKIVQRLPVRISLDPEMVKKYPIRIGLSADVNVNITDQDLPMLAQTPPKKPIAATSVFDIDMKEVDKTIENIVGQ